jgi:hypothetical protein
MTSPDGITWTARAAAEANQWRSVCWSPGLTLFCAVSDNGTNRVMTSPDGITWTARAAADAVYWRAVVWSPGLNLFCAVAQTGAAGTKWIMTSANGIDWTIRGAVQPANFLAVAWSPELSLFAAVSSSNKVFTSPDGITWTERAPSENNLWYSIAWSPEMGLFVAVSLGGTNRVMTSPDGITWTARAAAEANEWLSIAWSPALNLFVAVAATGTNRVMTWDPADMLAIGNNGSVLAVIVGKNKCLSSANGIAWTSRVIPAGTYYGVIYANGLYVAVGDGVVATSTDGVTWAARTPANTNTWRDLVYAFSLYIAVASNGNDRVMTSADGITWSVQTAAADFALSYLDGPTSYLIRDQAKVHYLWRDEVSTLHTDGDTTLPQWNLGYLESTDDPPTTREDAYYKIYLQKAPVRLDITDGDKIHFTPYWSIDPTKTIDAMMQVSEHLNLKKSPSWWQDIRSIIMFNSTEGGALPSTIERVAAYTPLVSTGFDGNLSPAVNNLQAFAQAMDDLDLTGGAGAIPISTAENDFQIGGVGGTLGTWVKKTFAQTITILRASLDSIYAAAAHLHTTYILHSLATAANDFLVASGSGAFVKKTLAEVKTILGLGTAAYTAATDYAVAAKGVTNGDSHDHAGGDGAQIDHGGLAGLSDDDHTQYIKHSLATAANDFLVASGAGAYVKKTLAEVKTILTMATGEATLGAAYSITGLAGVFEDSGLSVALPAAGTYLVTAEVRGQLKGNAGTAWWLSAEFYNSTDGAAVTNSERLIVLTATTAVLFQMTCPLSALVTVAAGKTIKLYVCRDGTGGASWTTSNIQGAAAAGQTQMRYIQIMK